MLRVVGRPPGIAFDLKNCHNIWCISLDNPLRGAHICPPATVLHFQSIRRVRMEQGAGQDTTSIEKASHTNQAQDPGVDDRLTTGKADLTGTGVCPLFHASRSRPVRRDHLGATLGRHRQRARRSGVRAARRGDSLVLVAAGDQHRRLEVFPRADRDTRPRTQHQAAHRARRGHAYQVGPEGRLLRLGGRCRELQLRI